MHPETSASAPSQRAANLAIAVLCLVWGSTWIVIKEGLRDLPPQTSGAARFWIAGLAMTGLARAFGRREGGASPPRWMWFALGSLSFGVSYAIVYRTSARLPSGLISLLWGVFPMLSAVVGHLWIPGERLTARQWWGFALGLCGLALLFATDLRALGPDAIASALVLLASPLASVAGNTLVKLRGAHVSSLQLNRNAMFVGAGWLTLAALVSESPSDANWSARALASVLYLSLAGTVLTFGLYFWLLRYVRSNRMSLIAYVTPTIALFFGAAFGAERITPTIVCGAASIVAGIVLVVRAAPRRPGDQAR